MSVLRGVPGTLSFCLAILLAGCSPKSSDIVVLEVGTHKVTLGEYENFYTRNTGGWETARLSTMEERERFLDLLTNYKLKLRDAHDRNLMNDSDVVSELREYRGSLASTFMLDRDLTDPGIRRLYERRKEEIRAQLILLSLKPDATPEETLIVYTKAMELIKRAKGGEAFDVLATQFSEDPSGKSNGGDLYYFTSGQLTGALENTAYGLQKGEVSSLPSKSSFGYLILKVTDRQPVRGSIKARHIMARFQSTTPDSADSAGAYSRILTLQDSLHRGADFAMLAQKLSEDVGSAPSGGDLGWFERRRWVQPFDEACFKLKVGEISSIVRTPYGFHIVRLDSVKPLLPLSNMKEELKKAYQQQKYNEDYAAFVNNIKAEVGFSFNEATFKAFVASLDSTKSIEDSAWDGGIASSLRAQALLTIHARPITLDTALVVLTHRPEYRNTSLRERDLRARFDRIAESLLLEAKSTGLEARYPEFGLLMAEYDDGVVLYKAEQMEVWSKTTVSDTALRSYYTENAGKFILPERVNIAIIETETDTIAAMIYDSLTHGANFTTLASRHNADEAVRTAGGELGFQPVTTDELTMHAATMAVNDLSEPIELKEGGFAIVKLLAREPAREKTFEEAGAEVSNAYQESQSKMLEKNWLDRIRQKYPVKQYKDALRDAFKSPPSSR